MHGHFAEGPLVSQHLGANQVPVSPEDPDEDLKLYLGFISAFLFILEKERIATKQFSKLIKIAIKPLYSENRFIPCVKKKSLETFFSLTHELTEKIEI